jgi:hypothetical protein
MCNYGYSTCDVNKYYCSNSAINDGWPTYDCGDKVPPQYSNLQRPQDPSLYSPTATYNFNATWIDNRAVDTVILQMDGVNYTSLTKTGNTYSLTFATCTSGGSGGGGGGGHFYMCSMDPITPLLQLLKFLTRGTVRAADTPCLGVGIHYYKWYASDTSNNWNSTNLLSFTILAGDPLIVNVISPESKTYFTTLINLIYSVEDGSNGNTLSWIGYSLDNTPNVTLTGNTSINVALGTHNIVFYANNTWGNQNSTQRSFTVTLPTTTTTTITTTRTTTTTVQSCTCSNWEPTFDCCYYRTGSKERWTRTCTPRGCAAESKCEGYCFI